MRFFGQLICRVFLRKITSEDAMFRRVWNRATALALPLMLAICLPPLAVIAFNLHTASAAATRAVVHSAEAKPEKHSAGRGVNARRSIAASAQQNEVAANRK